jgi:hypothetical protein
MRRNLRVGNQTDNIIASDDPIREVRIQVNSTCARLGDSLTDYMLSDGPGGLHRFFDPDFMDEGRPQLNVHRREVLGVRDLDSELSGVKHDGIATRTMRRDCQLEPKDIPRRLGSGTVRCCTRGLEAGDQLWCDVGRRRPIERVNASGELPNL